MTTITTIAYTSGDHSWITGIAAGEDYRFSNSTGGYVTVYQGGPNTGLLGHGPNPLTVTAVSGDDVYVHWSASAACDFACSGTATTTVQLLGGGGGCPSGEIEDCNGNCAPADWVGDGFCDDGSFTHNGIPIFFNCPEFGNDGGDCAAGGDCDNSSASGQWPNSTIAVDPGGAVTTIATNMFNASEFSVVSGMLAGSDYQFTMSSGAYITVREGAVAGPVIGAGFGPLTVTAASSVDHYIHYTLDAACNTDDTGTATNTVQLLGGGGGCPSGEIEDCNGNCAPADWVGDGFCDDGSFTHNGIPIFFNCPEFGNDGGDCAAGGACDNSTNPEGCGMYPFSAVTVDIGGGLTTIATDQYSSGEYSQITGIAAGEDYEFVIASGSYITVYQDGVNTTLLASGYSPLTVTALSAGDLFAHWSEDDLCTALCGDGSLVVSTVQLLGGGTGAPANDASADAITISCVDSPVSGTTTGSTVDADYIDCGADGDNTTQRGVWYRIEGDDNQYTITTCDASGTGYDTRLTVYSGAPGAFACVTANDDMTPACAFGTFRSRVQFNANSGTDYYVYVHGYQLDPNLSATGDFILNIECAPLCAPVPANDLCINAEALTVDAPLTLGYNSCANATAGNPACESAFATLPDVFYTFQADASGSNVVVIELLTAANLGYAIYDGCGGTQVACVANVTSSVGNQHGGLTPGAIYYIRVETEELTTGDFAIAVNSPPPAPANDQCSSVTADALAVPGSIGFSGTTVGATNTNDFAPGSELEGLDPTVWHAFTTTECANVTVAYCGTTPAFGDGWIFLSPSCPAGDDYVLASSFNTDDCGDGNFSMYYNTLPAGTYYVPVMFDAATANGPYTLTVSSVACAAVPDNDDCANAAPLPVNAAGDCPANAVAGDNSTATQDGGVPDCDTTTEQFLDVWYTFESGANTDVVIDIAPGTMTDLVLEVFEGAVCSGVPAYCEIGVLNNVVAVTPGLTYTVRVMSNTEFGAGGSYTICISEPAPPYDPCASTPAIACNTPTSTGDIVGDGAWLFPTCDAFADTPGQERIYIFTPPEDGDYTITVSALAGGYVDFFWKPVSDGCDESDWICQGLVGTFDILPVTLDPIVGLSAGQPIYVMVDPEQTTATSVTFQVDCPLPDCVDPNLEMVVNLSVDGPLPTWEVREVGTDALVQSGGGAGGTSAGPNVENICVPPTGNYYFVVGGSSIGTTYVLRTPGGSGDRIIDNIAPAAGGHQVAEVGTSNGTIQMPVSDVRLISIACDKYWWKNGDFIVANEDPAVAALWNNGVPATQASTGYDFWFYDPNGTYSFIKSRRHNTSDGFGTGSSRACHAKVNGWSGNQIPEALPLNVRVRAVVDGTAGNWGAACRFTLDTDLANCPPTLLINLPGHQYFSCGVTRQFTTHNNNRLFAQPVSGANQYEFQFRVQGAGEGAWDISRTVPTYYVNLGWGAGVAAPLVSGTTYDVRVRARKGAEWCAFGPLCSVTIGGGATGGGQNSALEAADAQLGMWPNPNRGDLLNVSLSAVEEGVTTVTMDLYDLSGKRVTARTLAVQDGFVNQVVDLSGDLAGGMYMVQFTAGSVVYTERLVIQP